MNLHDSTHTFVDALNNMDSYRGANNIEDFDYESSDIVDGEEINVSKEPSKCDIPFDAVPVFEYNRDSVEFVFSSYSFDMLHMENVDLNQCKDEATAEFEKIENSNPITTGINDPLGSNERICSFDSYEYETRLMNEHEKNGFTYLHYCSIQIWISNLVYKEINENFVNVFKGQGQTMVPWNYPITTLFLAQSLGILHVKNFLDFPQYLYSGRYYSDEWLEEGKSIKPYKFLPASSDIEVAMRFGRVFRNVPNKQAVILMIASLGNGFTRLEKYNKYLESEWLSAPGSSLYNHQVYQCKSDVHNIYLPCMFDVTFIDNIDQYYDKFQEHCSSMFKVVQDALSVIMSRRICSIS